MLVFEGKDFRHVLSETISFLRFIQALLVLLSSLVSYMWHLQEDIHIWKLPEVQNLCMLKPVFKKTGWKAALVNNCLF